MIARVVDTRRLRSGRRPDDAQVRHLHQAARSAGEAFAFQDEVVLAPPRSIATALCITLVVFATIGLIIAYS